MKSKDEGLGCGEAMIHGAIQELSTDSVKLVDSRKIISTRKETREGLDRETSLLEDTLNQSMTVVLGKRNDG